MPERKLSFDERARKAQKQIKAILAKYENSFVLLSLRTAEYNRSEDASLIAVWEDYKNYLKNHHT